MVTWGGAEPSQTTITKVVLNATGSTYTIPNACKYFVVCYPYTSATLSEKIVVNDKAPDLYQNNSSNGDTATWFDLEAGSILKSIYGSFSLYVITLD